MPRWTAVTTRTPQRGGKYLVYAPERGVSITQQHPSWWNLKDKRGPEFNGDVVTHWMTIPAPPKVRR